MSNKNNIDDLFRRSEPRLIRRPSSRAWDRLESRLDNHNVGTANKPNPWMKYGGMVAAVLVLALAASTLNMFNNTDNQSKEQYAMLEDDLVDISSYKNNSFAKYVDYQKEYLKFDKIFAEGDIEKNFIRKQKIRSNKEETPALRERALAEATDIAPVKKSEPTFTVEAEITEEVKGKVTDTKVEENKLETMPSNIIKEDLAMNVIPSDKINNTWTGELTPQEKNEDIKFGYTEQDNAGISLQKDNVPIPPTAIATPSVTPSSTTASGVASNYADSNGKSKKNSSNDRGRGAEVTYDLDKEESDFIDVAEEAEEEKEINPLDDFAWMVGDWKEKGRKGSESVEEWKKIDDFTIKGTGLLKVNGVALFSDEIIIRRKGENVILETKTNTSSKTIVLDFKKWDRNTAIFENENNKVFIQKNSNNKFTITLEGLSNFDPKYISNRNAIGNNRASREMKRQKKQLPTHY